MTLYASLVLKQGGYNPAAGKHDASSRQNIRQGEIKDLIHLPGKSVGVEFYTFRALICLFHFDKEGMWDAEDDGHRPAPGQQTADQAQAVELHRRSPTFQGAHELLVPEDTDEEGCVDAAGFREVGKEKKHATVGFAQEPSFSEICQRIGQIHQVVGDEVGNGQVDEKDLVGPDSRFLIGQGAHSQPVISQDPCEAHECSN